MNTVGRSGTYRHGLEKKVRFDKKVHRIMIETKARYKASCVARLYLIAERGGYGLKSVQNSLEEATIYS